eukprot:TRINITY_DN106_c0_g1_i2.p1 TRINITY_DN106_c0_g1~~TRINITY_DN106_c0_g1_i2.p1  ORF type:complete len:302 (+),score=86.59 TRINITY_DN106_c0_g1_i2:80-985(+)
MLSGSNDQQKLNDLGSKTHKEQSIWFLNAFWKTIGEQNAEKVWDYTHRYEALDPKGKEGNSVDEFNAHRFLEQNNETLTVVAMREHMRKVGVEAVKWVPISHFYIYRYGVNWHELVNAAQGDNQEEVAKAQRMLAEAQAACEAAQAAESSAKRAEADAKAAQAELEAALAELKAQEDAYNNKTADLKRKSEEGSLVQRNKAKNELAQHLGEDPLPLRRAKINQEAAVRKAERTSKAAEEARVRAEAALSAALQSVDEAQAFLDEVKSRPGSAAGALWWIDRELHEARAYLPTSRGGYRKPK